LILFNSEEFHILIAKISVAFPVGDELINAETKYDFYKISKLQNDG